MESVTENNEQHIITCPWSVAEGRAGGVDTVMLDLARSEIGKRTKILSTDPQSIQYGNAKIIAAEQDNGSKPYPIPEWFSLGDWQLMHPEAHSSLIAKDVLDAMYEASEGSPHPVGTFERLIDHINQHGPNSDRREKFNSRFDEALGSIAPGTTVNWQDFFFLPSVMKFADKLTAKDCFQTFHWHSTLPDSLDRSDWGQKALEALSKVHRVYVHTDVYRKRLETLMDKLELPLPDIRRFDLGIDKHNLDQNLPKVRAESFEQDIPNFSELSKAQKELITEVFRTRDTIPHRTICIDRADPNKGLHYVLEGVNRFLDEELTRLGSLDALRSNYRFFGLHDLFFVPAGDRINLHGIYREKLREKFEEIQTKFPGIVFVAEPLTGERRIALASLMQNCHGITGGAQDGLSLAGQENAYVNKDCDTALIVGDNAGFAMQAIANGSQDLAYFPQAGSPESLKEILHEVFTKQRTKPGFLREQKRQLLAREVLPRNARVAVSRFSDE